MFEVRDLWPEAPIQMGALRNPLAQRLARALERFVYARSARLIALSPGIRDGVLPAGQDASSCRTRPTSTCSIPNHASAARFHGRPTSAPWARRTT